MIPFLTVIAGLLRMTAAVTSVVASTPLVDAGIAMIPGLAAMSKIGNNFELERLNIDGVRKPEYFVVKSSFQTEKPGWEFWKFFVDLKARTAEAAADLLFHEKNDLVVDTSSMTYLSRSAEITNVCDFGDTDDVYHTNYFGQKKTVSFIEQSCQIP